MTTTTTSVVPTTTIDPLAAADAGISTNYQATSSLGLPKSLHNIYLGQSGSDSAFQRLINLLLDNSLNYVSLVDPAGLLSAQPHIDPFGLTVTRDPSTQPRAEGQPTHNFYDMLEISSPQGRELLQGYHASNLFGKQLADLNIDEQAELDAFIEQTYAGHEYLYIVEEPAMDINNQQMVDDPTTTDIDESVVSIAVLPTYDGTPLGNITNIEQALAGMPLDRLALRNFMTNLSATDPDMFGALQGLMSTLGYYGDSMPEWGGRANNEDRTAFLYLMEDVINEHLRIEEHNRRNPGMTLPSTEITSFLDRKFAERIGNVKSATQTATDFLESSDGLNLTEQVNGALRNIWQGSGKTITPKVEAEISATIQKLYADGEIEGVDALMNTDITGIQSSDDQLALADSFASEYFGGESNWQSNIRLGVNGSNSEIIRMAKAAGVQISGHDYPAQGMYPNELTVAPTAEENLNMYRWYFVTLLNKNNGDLERTANEFAHTYGGGQFRRNNSDMNWLNEIIRNTTSPGSFGSMQGARTLEEQSRERIDALDSLEKRVMAASGFTKIKNETKRQAVGAVLNAIGGKVGQRTSRL